MPAVTQSVEKRYPIWVSGRRYCSAMSRAVLYPIKNTPDKNQGFFLLKNFHDMSITINKHIPSRSISKSGEGKWLTQPITIGSIPSYGVYPGSSWLIQLPMRPSPIATGTMTARVSMSPQNWYLYRFAKIYTHITTPMNPPWKLIPHSQIQNIWIGWSIKNERLYSKT